MRKIKGLFNSLRNKINEREMRKHMALYDAVKKGNLSIVKGLLKSGANPNVKGPHRLTALHQAAYWGETEILKELLAHRAKVNSHNGYGWTPLHSAAISGGLKNRKEIIQILLEAGANMNQPDRYGRTSQDYIDLWALKAKEAEVLKKKLAKMEGADAIHPISKKTPKLNIPKH